MPRRWISNAACAGALLASLAAPPAMAGIKTAWFVGESEKIGRFDLGSQQTLGWTAPRFDPATRTVRLSGARNESIGFQTILTTDDTGASAADVQVSDLRQLDGAGVIPGSPKPPYRYDPFRYVRPDGAIELFTEHYLEVTQRTTARGAWFFAVAPDGYEGWLPDALIPFAAMQGKGGAPFDIGPSQNQGVWLDIHIPRDAPAGRYRGEIAVLAQGEDTRRFTLELDVLPLTLGDENPVRNMFGLDRSSLRYAHALSGPPTAATFVAVERRYDQMAHRHGMDLVRQIDRLQDMDAFEPAMNGKLYTEAFGYSGPGAGLGNRVFSIGPLDGALPVEYGSRPGGCGPTVPGQRGGFSLCKSSDWQAGSSAWAKWFRDRSLGDVAVHKYLFPDEPKSSKVPDAFGLIKTQADWTRSNPDPGGRIPTLVTSRIDPALEGAVDWWMSPAHHTFRDFASPDVIASERAAGRKWGYYNGFRPLSGSIVIDTPATDFRVIPWIAYKYNVDLYFYWDTTNWGRGRRNVFRQAITYDDGSAKANGDGSLFYPGSYAVFPDDGRGFAGPMSSIRMKNWRRGVQDVKYLELARKAGLSLDAVWARCLSAALWDRDRNRPPAWPDRGEAFDGCRDELARQLVARASPAK
ncbi:DUF4091 domain-containing protein [Alsobacter sp. SYSU M60028]|uniref:DUF4091 domain-containing protein n=1 Tax=Alsobacter ponti TaxID=2962936 RepID=A0ABT1LA82_9HYPH|nr:DUF4091 domain-containing protein [Alsobacter ponti]